MYQFIILCAFLFGSSDGMTDDEVRTDFVKVVMKCNKDIKVEPQHLISLQKKIMPDDAATGCLMACAYRQTGLMDDKGMFSLDGAAKASEKYYGDNPTKSENNKKLAEFCKKANDESVSDGEKGCERAALVFKCIAENSVKYGLKV